MGIETVEVNETAKAEPLLRSRQYWAERLGICAATLARASRRGELSVVRIGDRALHSPAQIESWLASRTSATRSR